jgi:hypothetical protein
MSFFLSPFRFLFELIGFLLSAAFIYGLALIAAVTIIWYGISTMPQIEPEVIIEYKDRIVKEFVPVIKSPSLICERLSGCKVFPNAETEKEYCPTCIVK